MKTMNVFDIVVNMIPHRITLNSDVLYTPIMSHHACGLKRGTVQNT